ncbi:MAG TPA: beta-N-acetylhexosaminidase [Longimicrobiales bacterium]|nr:beta-N-acetylhexosaminidase [Longimicrobiales bacterium]
MTAMRTDTVGSGLLTLLGLVLLSPDPVASQAPEDLSRYPLIPWPRSVEPAAGAFVLTEGTAVSVDHDDARLVAELWADGVRLATGFPLAVVPADSAPATGTVAYRLDAGAGTGDEGYRLSVDGAGIVVTAATAAGLFYGAQTLRQLLPPAVDRGGFLSEHAPRWEVPSVRIEDEPRFGYRGMHLDVGRHFFPVAFVKRYLDLLALYKMNRFHWHLTEDQGWRIEIRAYPRLTEVGAWRRETLCGHYGNRPHTFDGERYGGYYTRDEVREIVAYAAERHITVIPEIEMPGHSLAALAAYPELACTEGPFEPATLWGVFEDIYCPSEATFTFLESVLAEVMELFPGPWIHIGGDEAPKARWRESALAQEVIRREGLADEHELQSWFLRRIETFLNAHGRRLVGWDEIAEGGLSSTATLMFWRDWNREALQVAAEQGNEIIMTPNSTLYFDHYQGDPGQEPVAFGGLSTLEDVYAYEPVPRTFTPEQATRVLGAQGNVWTEYMRTPQKVEYMVLPRLLALAEVVWSARADRNWLGFRNRLPTHLERLDRMTVNYRRPRW